MKKVTVQLVDDLDGSVIEEDKGRTVSFSFEGDAFEIDLSNKNAEHLHGLLEPYLTAGRRIRGAGRQSRGTGSPVTKNPELQAIRDWARANGHIVSDRGRISASIREAYAIAHS